MAWSRRTEWEAGGQAGQRRAQVRAAGACIMRRRRAEVLHYTVRAVQPAWTDAKGWVSVWGFEGGGKRVRMSDGERGREVMKLTSLA